MNIRLAAFATLCVAWVSVSNAAPIPPQVTPAAASAVDATTATLNAVVNPNGASSFGWFEWGATTNYAAATASQDLGQGSTPLAMSASLAELAPGTIYHFRAVATNSAGGTVGADTTFATASPRNSGTALSFDGLDDYLRIGAPPISPPWTAEFWVKCQPASYAFAVLIGDSSTAILLESPTPFGKKCGWVNWALQGGNFSYACPTNQWVHLAFVATNFNQPFGPRTFIKLYTNGVYSALADAGGSTMPGSTNFAFTLGLSRLGSDDGGWAPSPINATVDEVRIWSTNRTPAELQANLYAPLPVPLPHLEAYWRFDEGSGSVAHDSSGNGYDAELVNGPVWVTSDIGFRPWLSIRLGGAGTAVVGWPSTSTGFILGYSTNMVYWADVALPVYDDGTTRSVTVSLSQSQTYYRLRRSGGM